MTFSQMDEMHRDIVKHNKGRLWQGHRRFLVAVKLRSVKLRLRVLCFIAAFIGANGLISDLPANRTRADLDEIARNISAILKSLVHPNAYDKRLRPDYGGDPVNVGITIYVSSISAVSEVAMDYTLDFYLRQTWFDRRLAFNSYVNELTIDVEYQKAIWVPDTFFPNEKHSYFHLTTTHNSFLRIDSRGNVLTSQRITVTAACPMSLHYFPLDSQECSLELESYGYSTKDVRYFWFKGEKDSVSLSDSVTLPQFKVTGRYYSELEEVLATGNYSRMKCTFVFSRSLGFYLITLLIVIISWVSFWLNRNASPARVALGVTTVLTMTTLMSNTNATLPKVSYVKSIDIYLGTCFLMVFASLIEYAAVGYLSKKQQLAESANKPGQQPSQVSALSSQEYAPSHVAAAVVDTVRKPLQLKVKHYGPPASARSNVVLPVAVSPEVADDAKGSFVLTNPKTHSGAIEVRRREKGKSRPVQVSIKPFAANVCYRRLPTVGANVSASEPSEEVRFSDVVEIINPKADSAGDSHRVEAFESPARNGVSHRPMFHQRTPSVRRPAVTPSDIDKYSRLFFPLTFICFNALYWTVYLYISRHPMTHNA